MKILVVGAGIAGSCVALAAREQGHQVTVAAAPSIRAASHAALCVIRPQWWKGQTRRDALRALSWYQDYGALAASVATYTRYDREGFREDRTGYYSVSPPKCLVEPSMDLVYHRDDRPAGYDVVVECLGAWADSDAKRSWGTTTFVLADSPPLQAHFARPREVLFATCQQGMTRFGSSVATTQEDAVDKQQALMQRAPHLIPEGPRSHMTSVRLMPATIDAAGPITQINATTWELNTLGRVGYSIAPARAETLMRYLS